MVDTSNLFDLREHADHGRLSTALVPTSSTWSASTTNVVFQTNVPESPERGENSKSRPTQTGRCAVCLAGDRGEGNQLA